MNRRGFIKGIAASGAMVGLPGMARAALETLEEEGGGWYKDFLRGHRYRYIRPLYCGAKPYSRSGEWFCRIYEQWMSVLQGMDAEGRIEERFREYGRRGEEIIEVESGEKIEITERWLREFYRRHAEGIDRVGQIV